MGVRAATLRRLALSLPETIEAPHHDLTSFRVAGNIFATMPPEGDRFNVFLDDEEISASCAEFPGAVEELSAEASAEAAGSCWTRRRRNSYASS